MSKHTPGPWRWTDGEKDIDIATYQAPGYYNNPALKGVGQKGYSSWSVIGNDEYWVIGPHDHDEMVANARLIAAAPDLLDELKRQAERMGAYAARLRNVHLLMAREMEQDAASIRAAFRAAGVE